MVGNLRILVLDFGNSSRFCLVIAERYCPREPAPKGQHKKARHGSAGWAGNKTESRRDDTTERRDEETINANWIRNRTRRRNWHRHRCRFRIRWNLAGDRSSHRCGNWHRHVETKERPSAWPHGHGRSEMTILL